MKELVDTLMTRIEMRVGTVEGTECIEWPGARNAPEGYGVIGYKSAGRSRLAYAHRIVFEAYHGEIPNGAQVHHRCENKLCINPAHLALALTPKSHQRLFHPSTIARSRGVPCPRCDSDLWVQRYSKNGKRNGNRCADCHARTERNR